MESVTVRERRRRGEWWGRGPRRTHRLAMACFWVREAMFFNEVTCTRYEHT